MNVDVDVNFMNCASCCFSEYCSVKNSIQNSSQLDTGH